MKMTVTDAIGNNGSNSEGNHSDNILKIVRGKGNAFMLVTYYCLALILSVLYIFLAGYNNIFPSPFWSAKAPVNYNFSYGNRRLLSFFVHCTQSNEGQ
jgi:hypothetical protein